MEARGKRVAPVGEWWMILVVVAIVFVVTGAAGYWYYQKTRPMGPLEVTTVPADAIALVDGRRLDGRSPFSIREKLGHHTLIVLRAGYVPSQQTIDLVSSDTPAQQQVTLEPTVESGFEIFSDPPGAEAWLDGSPVRDPSGSIVRTNFRANRISPGRHVIELRSSLSPPWRLDFQVEPDRIRRITADLTPPSAARPQDKVNAPKVSEPYPPPPGL